MATKQHFIFSLHLKQITDGSEKRKERRKSQENQIGTEISAEFFKQFFVSARSHWASSRRRLSQAGGQFSDVRSISGPSPGLTTHLEAAEISIGTKPISSRQQLSSIYRGLAAASLCRPLRELGSEGRKPQDWLA